MTNTNLEVSSEAADLYSLSARIQSYQVEMLARRAALWVTYSNGMRYYCFKDGSMLVANDAGYIGTEGV